MRSVAGGIQHPWCHLAASVSLVRLFRTAWRGRRLRRSLVRVFPFAEPFPHAPTGKRRSNSADSDYRAFPVGEARGSPSFSDWGARVQQPNCSRILAGIADCGKLVDRDEHGSFWGRFFSKKRNAKNPSRTEEGRKRVWRSEGPSLNGGPTTTKLHNPRAMLSNKGRNPSSCPNAVRLATPTAASMRTIRPLFVNKMASLRDKRTYDALLGPKVRF